MKALFSALLLVSSPVFANSINEVVQMTNECIRESLIIPAGDATYQITSQEFTTPITGAILAIQSDILIRSVHSGGTSNATCTTQFIKNNNKIEVFQTECHAL